MRWAIPSKGTALASTRYAQGYHPTFDPTLAGAAATPVPAAARRYSLTPAPTAMAIPRKMPPAMPIPMASSPSAVSPLPKTAHQTAKGRTIAAMPNAREARPMTREVEAVTAPANHPQGIPRRGLVRRSRSASSTTRGWPGIAHLVERSKGRPATPLVSLGGAPSAERYRTSTEKYRLLYVSTIAYAVFPTRCTSFDTCSAGK